MAPLTRPLSVEIHKKVFPAIGQRAEIAVLKDIVFQVEPGSFVVITGPSGGGKTTLLNIIAGLDKNFDGKIDYGDKAEHNLAYVFQSPRLCPGARSLRTSRWCCPRAIRAGPTSPSCCRA